MDDLEELLARYRPAGPPPQLRPRVVDMARVSAEARSRSRLRDWIPAAAALALATLFCWLAANQERMLANRLWIAPGISQEMAAPMDLQEWRP